MSSYNRNYYSSNSNSISGVFYIIILIFVCGYFLVSCNHNIDKGTNMRTVTTTVTDKGIKNYNDDSKYLVFTKDENGNVETYEVTDSWVAGRFNSSDVYAGIEIGKTYEFTVAGERNNFMSWYPNIYKYKEINNE